jgi:hypothetical protein
MGVNLLLWRLKGERPQLCQVHEQRTCWWKSFQAECQAADSCCRRDLLPKLLNRRTLPKAAKDFTTQSKADINQRERFFGVLSIKAT